MLNAAALLRLVSDLAAANYVAQAEIERLNARVAELEAAQAEPTLAEK